MNKFFVVLLFFFISLSWSQHEIQCGNSATHSNCSSTIVTSSQACPLKKIQCENFRNRRDCQSIKTEFVYCKWENYECIVKSAQCSYFSSEYECQARSCKWVDQECKIRVPKFKNCSEKQDYYACVFKFDKEECSWEHNKCIPINRCSDANEIHKCRGVRLNERCVVVRNGRPDKFEGSFKNLLPQIFESIQCRSLDCVYQYDNICPQFLNGRRCFKQQGKCTQCSYLTSQKDCIQSNECTWQDRCRNILCSDLTSKVLCQSKHYCIFDDHTLLCKTRTDGQFYCYSYDKGNDSTQKSYRDI